jgi:hypothetical protein
LCLLFFHLPQEELTRPIVTTLLASQIFLNTRYRYDLAATEGTYLKRTPLYAILNQASAFLTLKCLTFTKNNAPRS